MEDSRLLSLIDKLSTAADPEFEQICQELVGLFKKYLSKSKKIQLASDEQNKLRTYLTKRLLNGSTSDETKVQDRDSDLQGFFDCKETFEAINELCSVKNAIKKSERKYFAYSHVTNVLCFYIRCTSASLEDLKQILQVFVSDSKDSLYFVGAYLSGLRRSALSKPQTDRVHALVEELCAKKTGAESYRQATYLLALQNVCKAMKLRIDNSKYDTLEGQCASLVSSKSLNKYFEEVVQDDNLNSHLRVALFEEAIVNVLHRSNEKAISKLFKFFHSVMDTVQKDKSQRQKKAFHLIGCLRAFIENVDSHVLLSMDLEQSLSRQMAGAENGEAHTIADIFVDLIGFWMKQFGNKSPESKLAAAAVDHELANKIKTAEKSTSQKLTIFMLRILKFQPTNSLRGTDMKLMQTLLGLLYQDDASFHKYFNLILSKIKASTKISELNFYLNELEHLGQISLSAKQHKEMDNEREANLRCSVLKSLIEVYLHCETEKELEAYFGGNSGLDWSEQELSFRKFRNKIFERILNLVFKREDNLLLAKAAAIYGDTVGGRDEEIRVFFKKVLESAGKFNKSHQVYGNLQRALVFQNVFEDDIAKNADIVSDILTSCQMMCAKGDKSHKKLKTGTLCLSLESEGQKPEDVFVDSLIALCSTSYPQAKHVVNSSFEACSDQISRVGFSLMFQAVVREDSKYLQEDAEVDDEDGQEVEGAEEGLEGGEDPSDESEDEELDAEDALLGKRMAKQNGKSAAIDKATGSKAAKHKSRVAA